MHNNNNDDIYSNFITNFFSIVIYQGLPMLSC